MKMYSNGLVIDRDQAREEIKLWADEVVEFCDKTQDLWNKRIVDENNEDVFSLCTLFPRNRKLHMYSGIEIMSEVLNIPVRTEEIDRDYDRLVLEYRGLIFFQLKWKT